MTKNKENDFIKVKVVKMFCYKEEIKISEENITELKTIVRTYLDNKKKEQDEEKTKENLV
jgi:hypothetical protein